MTDKKGKNKDNHICSFCTKSKDENPELIFVSAGPAATICSECAELSIKIVKEEKTLREKTMPAEAKTSSLPTHTPRQIKDFLSEYVIGQDSTKKTLAIAVYNHYHRLQLILDGKDDNILKKSNILMIGSTGSGKTHTLSTLARFLDVPFAIADATTITEAGYVGDDAENIIARLIENAGGDVEKAQKGIVYIDEIDKIARKGESASITRDVSGEGVQHALLKLIEGTVCSVAAQGVRKASGQPVTMFDTTNVLFICGGAFDGLPKIISARTEDKGSIGFSAPVAVKKDSASYDILPKIETQDLIKFGLVPELIGRLPIITTLQDLDKEALKSILTKPKDALVKQYQTLFITHDVELSFTEDALEAVAQEAINKKTGARGLRSIIERVLQDVMFELPEMEKGSKVEITEENVKGSNPLQMKVA